MKPIPYIKFFPADVHHQLSTCTIEAWGTAFKLLMLMHASKRPGYLIINGAPATVETVARVCQLSLSLSASVIDELVNSAFIGRTHDGTLFCPVILQQIALRDSCSKNGKMGGNPVLKRPWLKPPDNPLVIPREGNGNGIGASEIPGKGSAEGNPHGGQPTLAEVKARAAMICLPEGEAEKFFNHFDAQGWRTGGGGATIVNFHSKLGQWKAKWQEDQALGKAHKGYPKATLNPHNRKPSTSEDHAKGLFPDDMAGKIERGEPL